MGRLELKLGFSGMSGRIRPPTISKEEFFFDIMIYVCPADPWVVNFRGVSTPTTRSYSMSSSMQGDLKYSAINDPKPVKAIVFMDEQHNLKTYLGFINDGNIGLRTYDNQSERNNWGDSPARRHNNGVTVSMADGHAEYWKWRSNREYFRDHQAAQPDEIPDLRRIQQGLPGYPNQ